MVISCSAINCSNRQNCGKDKLQFHKFPIKNTSLCQKWLLSMRKNNWKPNRYAVICSAHFTDDDYRTKRRRYLKPYAVPTIFNFPQDQQEVEEKRDIIPQHEIKDKTNDLDLDAPNIFKKQCPSVECSTSTSDLITYHNKEIQTDKIAPTSSILYHNKGVQANIRIVGPKEVKLRKKIMLLRMELLQSSKKRANLEIILQYLTNICKINEEEFAKLDEIFGEEPLE